MKVLVCDDFKDEAGRTASAVLKGWTAAGLTEGDVSITPLAGEDLANQLQVLFKNIAITMGEKAGEPLEPTAFDNCDLVFIDNNLAHLDLGGARHTAETVAGYIRAFCQVGVLVSLNRNPGVDFDLKHLIGDASSIADQALNVDHLALPGLWARKAGGDFRPWYWPELSTAPGRRERQIKAIARILDTDVFAHFGFNDSTIAALSRDALGSFSGKATTNEAAHGAAPLTFREFFTQSTRSIPTDTDRQSLAPNDEIVARVVAAELELWLRRRVLAPQEALVDVPHLLVRMGYLLAGRAEDLEAWNSAALETEAPFGIDAKIFSEFIEKSVWKPAFWLDVPVFQWPDLNADEVLGAGFFGPNPWGDFVFCEDTSTFVPREPADGADAAQEFAAELDGQWNRRFVALREGRKYAPRSRLAM